MVINIYPCVVCTEECKLDTICCSYCNKWVHQKCVDMSAQQLRQWSNSSLHFLCKSCSYTDGEFDCGASLQRIQTVLATRSQKQLKACVRSEQLLIETYAVKDRLNTRETDEFTSNNIDFEAISILKSYHPALLSNVVPLKVNGDGNCLYRSVSRALVGSEHLHILLRLLTAVELLTYPQFYDETHKNFKDLVKDNRIVQGSYSQNIEEVIKIGSFSSMTQIYALSAVLAKPIRSYYPPQLNSEFVSEPHTKKIVGRMVKNSDPPCMTIMWSAMNFDGVSFTPNHFVPLIEKTNVNEVHIDLRSDVQNSCDSPIGTQDGDDYADECNIDMQDDLDDCVSMNGSNDDKNHMLKVDDDDDDDDKPMNDDDEEKMNTQDNVDEHGSNETNRGYLANKFLDASTVVEMLMNSDESDAFEKIPNGKKENVFYVVKNDKNQDKKAKDIRSSFSDDCGVWDSSSGASPRSYFFIGGEGKVSTIMYRKGKYCKEKRVKGKKVFLEMEPQPDSSKVLILQRYYATLKLSKTYKKRVSWLHDEGSTHIAIVEYIGEFPGLSSHGNSKVKKEFVRTPAAVMEEMTEMLEMNKKPQEIYQKLSLKHDELSGPSSKKQVYDKKKHKKYKDLQQEGIQIHTKNLADHMKEIDNLVTEKDSIVKCVIRDQGKAPCIILYTNEQLDDLKQLCCSGQSLLGVDKTFNLCDMHVTATCYKQTRVHRKSTHDHPLFLGPLYIHDNSDFESYSNFFGHLRIKLSQIDTSNLVIGSDEEIAMVNAITDAFPSGTHVLCTRHLRENAKHKLTDCAVDKCDREDIISEIFGNNGLIEADDSICFSEKCEKIEEQCDKISKKFKNYFKNRLRGNIKCKVTEPIKTGKLEKQWTNNNCESVNHVLKQLIDWKSQPLLNLIEKIQEYVEGQFKDLKKALVSCGEFELSDMYRQFEVSRNVWSSKTTDERQRLYDRFRKFIPKKDGVVTSTDGQSTVIAPRAHGRKPGQRKRPIADRTTSIKRFKKTDKYASGLQAESSSRDA